MYHHKCTCMYVPDHVLGRIARGKHEKGREKARLSLKQAKESRTKRKSSVPSVNELATAQTTGAAGGAKRQIYDSQNQWVQQVKLVRSEGGAVTSDDAVNEAYDHAGEVLKYFKKELGRNSIDNNGMDLVMSVHFGVDYMNAFWDGDEMTFGDGDGDIFVSFTKSLDVIAHEVAHGVTQWTANLDYYSQSGALNEHFSDVFGSAIQQKANKQNAGNADWLVGNEIMGPTLYGEALRSMKAPGTAYDNPLMGTDPQPAHMDNYYAGPADNRGVHINSGIPNRAFYLVAMDIGTDKAALIWYTALQWLWPTADFYDAVEVIVDAARVLTKAGKINEGTTQSVRAAFRSVGL